MPKNSNQSKAQQLAHNLLFLKEHSYPKYSVDYCIADQSSSKSAVTRKRNLQTIVKFLFMAILYDSLLRIAVCDQSTIQPTVGYNDPQILTGTVTLSTDTLIPSVSDSDHSQMLYDISIDIPTTYSIHIGIHSLSVQNVKPNNHYACYIDKTHISGTVLRLSARYDDDLTFHYVRINYIVIEPNYFSAAVQDIGRATRQHISVLSSQNSISQNFSLSNIQSSHIYRAIKLLNYINLDGVDQNIVGNVFYTVKFDIQNSSLEHITQGNNIRLIDDQIRVLVFQFDTTQKTRLQFHTVQTSTSGDKLMSIDSDLQINESNTIIELEKFTITNTNMDFNFYHSSGEIWLQNSADSPNMKADIALIYTMQCLLDSYFYSDTDGLCHQCLESCFRCSNISVCEECAVNLTLQNSDTECNCPYPTVSGICYDFETSPMKGCESALIDSLSNEIICLQCSGKLILDNNECSCPFPTVSEICYDFENSPMKGCQNAEVDFSSNEIFCLQCSEAQNLILNNNECICKSGYQRADNSSICSQVLEVESQQSDSDLTGVIIGVAICTIVVLTGTGLLYYKYFYRKNRIRSMRQRPLDSQSIIFAPDFK